MFLRIEEFPETRLIGKKLEMSFAHNTTFELWRSFMPRRNEIRNAHGNDLFSLQIYPANMDFSDASRTFEKWAAVAVGCDENIPENMYSLVIPPGKYAVFLHSGPASLAAVTFGYIFNEWLPTSGFTLDDRPHFEILTEKYRHDAIDSEEEVWIPIR
ncbi:GyrI-like domain-containing protein [Flavobacterium sp. MAH-1]|uniref:GyrI-like domain-containing protein n=1 Tax=Flavobacterium agri TaxID=2743471 RepID=A0A7Y8XZH4_9FLAO|nr:GyrI-like domain-containing protein [Flavobacterium agri]NUY79796.1 GyrI-like domain-containing protein [Flavobacterium agri]NYA69821.1 GyrI-like domain-containing protein [Flavobacterium agri]